MKRLLAGTTVLAVLLLGFASPASACACGAPAPQPGQDVTVDHEFAIVSWENGVEQIVMRLAMRSGAGETGLVVPTPTPATVTLGDAEMFDALEREITVEPQVEWDWWGLDSGEGVGAPGGAPTVLDRVQLGPIEATTLAADDTEGLQTWLDEGGYALDPAVSAELGVYVDAGWSFVALRITTDSPLDGELDPIRFSFASDSLVYPMQLSRAASQPQIVRLYVLDEHRATVSGTGEDQLSIPWAGPVNDPSLAELGSYLTVLDFHFSDPATQIPGDIEIVPAPTDATVQPESTVTRVLRIGAIPVGQLGVAVVVVLLLAGGTFWLVRRSHRAR